MVARASCGEFQFRPAVEFRVAGSSLSCRATTSADQAAAQRAFEAMMKMGKIDIATIEAALREAG